MAAATEDVLLHVEDDYALQRLVETLTLVKQEPPADLAPVMARKTSKIRRLSGAEFMMPVVKRDASDMVSEHMLLVDLAGRMLRLASMQQASSIAEDAGLFSSWSFPADMLLSFAAGPDGKSITLSFGAAAPGIAPALVPAPAPAPATEPATEPVP